MSWSRYGELNVMRINLLQSTSIQKLAYPNCITNSDTAHDISISFSNHNKYLCVTHDRRLTWNKHILNLRSKTACVSESHKPPLNSKPMTIKNKILMWNVCIRFILTYSCSIWVLASKTNLEYLYGSHDKYLHRILEKGKDIWEIQPGLRGFLPF